MKANSETGTSKSNFSRHRLCAMAVVLVSTVLLAVAFGCGGSHSSSSAPAAAAPTISSFTAVKSTIASGTGTTLNWSVSNAATVSIDQGVGTVTGTSVAVTPTSTTIYTLTATNSAGTSVRAPVTVTVVGIPAISSFKPANSPITNGTSTTLNWVTTNATTFSINGAPVTGTSMTANPTADTTYTLTATNALGANTTATATVTVVAAPGITSFTASPTSSNSGDIVTLSWAVSGQTSVSIDNGVGPVTGTSTTVTPTATTTYKLTATNAAGTSVTKFAGVTVAVPGTPSITSFTATPGSSNSGDVVTLSWAVRWATSISIDNGVGPVTGSSTTVTPTATMTYTLTATNAGGTSATQAVTVSVQSLGAINSFLAAQPGAAPGTDVASTSAGGPVTLTAVLNSTNNFSTSPNYTSTVTNDQDSSSIALTNGVASTVTPSKTTTYKLTVLDSTSNRAQVAAVKVVVGSLSWFSGQLNFMGAGDGLLYSRGQCTNQGPIVINGKSNQYGPQFGSPSNSAFCAPYGMVADSSGNLFIADSTLQEIVEINASTQTSSVYSGIYADNTSNTTVIDNVPVAQATFAGPMWLAIAPSTAAANAGNMYVLGGECDARMISNGTVSTLAGNRMAQSSGGGGYCGISNIIGYEADGQGTAALFRVSAFGLVVDSVGDVIVAEQTNIRAVDISGNVTTIAGLKCLTTATCAIKTNFQDGAGTQSTTGTQAEFYSIGSIAIDPNDNIYVLDSYSVRKMVPDKSTGTNAALWSWTVTTLTNPAWAESMTYRANVDGPESAAEISPMGSLVYAPDGNLYFSASRYIRRIRPDGTIDTVAGSNLLTGVAGPGGYNTTDINGTVLPTTALLPAAVYPKFLAVDPTQKRLFIIDDLNPQILTVPY